MKDERQKTASILRHLHLDTVLILPIYLHILTQCTQPWNCKLQPTTKSL